MPDLRQLRAFVAVAEELNFTRAAARLVIAQQAVSRSVAQLEAELGVTLLERTTHAVALTPAGAALLASGRGVLAAADAAFAEAREVARGLSGRVRVGMTPPVGARVRTEVVRVLRDGAPDLTVSVHEVRPGEVPHLLRDRAVDVVLARTAPGAPEVESAALRPTPAVLVVAPGHRLAGAAAPVALAALDGERLLTWNPPGTPYTDLLLTRLAAAGARVAPVESRVFGVAELPDLAAEGVVAIVPEGFALGDGVVVPLAEPVDLPLVVLWPAGTRPAAVDRLRAGLASG